MATGVAPTNTTTASPRPHMDAPFASRRRPRFQRDSGTFHAARMPGATPELEELPVVESGAPEAQEPAPRVAATANLNRPDAAPAAPVIRTVKQDVRALALAFLAGVGLPLAAIVLRAALS